MGRTETGERNSAWGEIEIWLSPKLAEAVHQSLKPEAVLPAAGVKLRRGKTLWMRVEGKDLGALRAAFNSLLRWTSVAVEVVRSG
jgi:tRNA threonylcarbamoyladenosine modification (KEOPS) complex  Pcc1 subunit